MSEADLADKMLDLAHKTGWWWHHTRPAWTPKGFRSPLGGHTGFPDYVLARTVGRALNKAVTDAFGVDEIFPRWASQLLIVELKTELGALSDAQEEWRRRLEPIGCYRLWRPSSWPEIEHDLITR